MSRQIAFLFPAFAMKYQDFSRACLEGLEAESAELLARARRLVDIDAGKFDNPAEFVLDDPLEDDLQDQYVCYIDGCAVGRLLKKRGIAGDYVAGYSMGLFAALRYCSAVSFEDGLRLLHHTCTCVHEAIEGGNYGMGVVVGLTPDEVAGLIAAHGLGVEVADICGPRAVIAAGRRPQVERLLDVCEEEGCLNAKLLPVSAPFHSSLLCSVESKVRSFLAEIEIRPARRGLVSCVDQKVLRAPQDVADEAAKNVSYPIHWFKTMNRLVELGTDVFLECGLSESLSNLARRIEGNYRIYHPRRFERFFAPA